MDQSSLKLQVEKSQKELKATEQKLHHKNVELQAVQEKISSFNSQLSRETERLLRVQADALERDRIICENIVKDQEKEVAILESKISKLTFEKELLDKSIEEKQTSLKMVIQDVHGAEDDVAASRSKSEELKQLTISLRGEKVALEKSIADLSNKGLGLKTSISTIQAELRQFEDKLEAIKDECSSVAEEKDRKLSILDAKILQRSQQLEQSRREEKNTREEFATMQRILEERDKNLRIREAKVEIAEDKLVRNTNLMNL